MGSASKVWLYHSLKALQTSLDGKLYIYSGNPFDILKNLTEKYEIHGITWNRCYEPWQMPRDEEIKKHFLSTKLEVETCNGSLLWEPWDILKQDNTPYKVFTPFYQKGCLLNGPKIRDPLCKPENLELLP